MIKKIISGAILTALVSFSAVAQQWQQGSSGGYSYKYVTHDPTGARFYTLKNGLTVILAPTSKEPRIQAFVAVKAGSKTDPKNHTGLAHYLEHMLFKGTNKYGTLNWEKEKAELLKIDALYEKYNSTTNEAERKRIYREIDSVSGIASKYAIANEYDKLMNQMGAQGTNAFTSFEKTVYTDDVPASSLDKYLSVQAERFREPVLRLFHTELEAVYEEKNRSLDSDGSLVFETLFSNLFKKHNYGQQTTIGTVEHLKNPSLIEIRKYFNTYYVPNNMAIILSGDFNPESTIAKIDHLFSYMQPKEVPQYTFEAEDPITTPIVKEIVGPDAQRLVMGFRLPGNKSKDVLLANLVGNILTNGSAGLIDLNLVKQQKLLHAGAFAYTLIDHGVLYLSGQPKEGQSLQEVQNLILGEIENLKKGNFDPSLLQAIVNNAKKSAIENTEHYNNRAEMLMEAFTNEIDWKNQVEYTNNLSKITKADVVAFANKYLGNNFVAVHKKQGVRPSTQKIDKPQITPVETNSDKQSAFVKQIAQMPTTAITPVFLNYKDDIQYGSLLGAQVLCVQNKDNELYRLRYRYKIGSLNSLKLPLAAQYLQYLGTDKMQASQVAQAFYQIASSFHISTGEEYTTVTIEGLQENFTQAVALYENLVLNAQADEATLEALKGRITQSRANAKANRQQIMQGLTNYAIYGAKNKFNHVLSDQELQAITPAELLNEIKQLQQVEQTIIYYGPLKVNQLVEKLGKLHQVPTSFATAPIAKEFPKVVQNQNQVLFTNYEMVQAETRWVRNTETYKAQNTPVVEVFNNYFGGGMSSLVFQTIRESKALAYSTYGFYVSPKKKNDKYTILAYVGSQADKFAEATTSMNELLTTLPYIEANFNMAKEQVRKDLQTQRISQDDIIYNYLAAKELGLKKDLRKQVYAKVNGVSFKKINAFHQKHFSNKPYTYLVLASEKNITLAQLQKLGTVKTLSLEEIFGY